MELFEDRVQPCHWNVFKCQAFGWLYTRLAKKFKFEIFRLPGSPWGLLIQVEHFRLVIFWISKNNIEKYRTTGRLIILGLVTSLQERKWHWRFALQFLFADLHGQQPRPLFRAQAPLHGQETSTDPWSYSTRMETSIKKMYEWKHQHFHLLRNALKDFHVPL